MAPRSRPGPISVYRPKVRKALSFALTETGHRALASLLAHSSLSRSDLIEQLIRRAAHVPTDK